VGWNAKQYRKYNLLKNHVCCTETWIVTFNVGRRGVDSHAPSDRPWPEKCCGYE